MDQTLQFSYSVGSRETILCLFYRKLSQIFKKTAIDFFFLNLMPVEVKQMYI